VESWQQQLIAFSDFQYIPRQPLGLAVLDAVSSGIHAVAFAFLFSFALTKRF
jgi:hypothetical protein